MSPTNPTADPPSSWLTTVTERAADLKYGSILITIHDSRVTQIEVLEKVRIPTESKTSSPRETIP